MYILDDKIGCFQPDRKIEESIIVDHKDFKPIPIKIIGKYYFFKWRYLPILSSMWKNFQLAKHF